MRIKTTILFSLIATLGLASMAFADEQADGHSLVIDKERQLPRLPCNPR
jgi:hypothetical protein